MMGRQTGNQSRIDTRWATTNAAEIRRHAAELVTLAPLGHGHDIETLINGVPLNAGLLVLPVANIM